MIFFKKHYVFLRLVDFEISTQINLSDQYLALLLIIVDTDMDFSMADGVTSVNILVKTI